MKKNKIEFITEAEIFDRLKFFTPSDGESYFIQRDRFSVVGTCWYGERKKLFCVYSGTPESYEAICEMVKSAVVKIGFSVNIDE